MKRLPALAGAALVVLAGLPGAASGQDSVRSRESRDPATTPVRVFLDCNQCDTDYVMREVAFVDYVRDRAVADVHVLVTTQATGGGGTAWTLAFIGQDRFDARDRTLTFNTPQIATDDERRKEFARVFRIGLVQYAVESSAASQLDVTWTKPKDLAQTSASQDPWHYWVFRINGGGNFNGEESSNSHSYRFGFSGNRTTESWKINLSTNANANESHFDIGDGVTIESDSQNWGVNTLIVKSLGPKWSAGGRASMSHSSFSNNERTIAVSPGIEYDFFPYSESTRRSLTLLYSIGTDFNTYNEVTIFDKSRETVPKHSVTASLGLRQPWGSINSSAEFSQHLNHTDRSRWSVDGGADVRLFKGFSVNVFGRYEKIKDLISLSKNTASTEEVLLHLQQLPTGYSYFVNIGISYRFGSIFNNVVNPRFDGSGGGVFFF